MGIIYCLTSPSGKKYIGQTKRSFDKRLKEHSNCAGNCIILENAIKKYGIDSFDYEILIEINDTLLDEYETKFIDLLDTLEPNGYNVRSGGKIAAHSELSKERMRQSKLGDIYLNQKVVLIITFMEKNYQKYINWLYQSHLRNMIKIYQCILHIWLKDQIYINLLGMLLKIIHI
jgi:group I intron endonuclease